MTLKYQSGEEIKKGDRVLFHGEPGEVEFVVNENTKDPAMDWYRREFGGGVMIREPKHFGAVFIQVKSLPETEDLEFVSRAGNWNFQTNLLSEKNAKEIIFVID